MSKNSLNKNSKYLASVFIDALVNKNKGKANSALKEMVNNHISAKIKKVAQSEKLI